MNLEKIIHSVAASMELYVSFMEGEFVLDFCWVVSIPISTERSNERVVLCKEFYLSRSDSFSQGLLVFGETISQVAGR